MTKEKIDDAIFLNDDSIIDWKPVEKGYIINPIIRMCGVLTEVKKYLGYDKFQINEGNYNLNGIVSIYLVDLMRLDRNNMGNKPKPEEEIFFTGGLQIFKEALIPGTKLNGIYLIKNGRVWFAKKPLGDLEYSFYNYVFVNKKTNKIIKTIEKIIRGYESHEKQSDLDNRKNFHDSYMRGLGDAREEICGTFGGR